LKSLYTKDSPSGFRESRFSRVKNNPFFSLFRRKPLILLRRESIDAKINKNSRIIPAILLKNLQKPAYPCFGSFRFALNHFFPLPPWKVVSTAGGLEIAIRVSKRVPAGIPAGNAHQYKHCFIAQYRNHQMTGGYLFSPA
jgi:hypothetical protein